MNNQSNFLESLAIKCKSKFDNHCDQLTIIFPNKRAGIYFANYLAEQYKQPIWSPAIHSFEEYVENQMDYSLADDLQLIFLLYNTYKKIVKQPETFDAFYPWGEMILKDFNDIDNYLVEAQHIFRVIRSQKELDESFRHMPEEDQLVIQNFWKGFLPKPNKKQHEFISTWSILENLYSKFNDQLHESNLIYKGKLFREYAESDINIDSGSSFWFAGFNALTSAEEKIIKIYLGNSNSDIFWDLDEYYFSDTTQESGEFFRSYAKDPVFKPSIDRDLKRRISEENIKIEVLSAPFAMAQIKSAAQKIEFLTANTDQNDLLIILTDESMLPGVLDALPPHIEHANVTMGWPISHSRFYLLISKIIGLHYKKNSNTNYSIHHQEISSLLEYHDLFGIESKLIEKFKKEIIETNSVYLKSTYLKESFPSLSNILDTPKNVSKLIDVLIGFISQMDLKLQSGMERSIIVLIHATLKRLKSAVLSHGISLEIQSFYKLFQKLGGSIKIPLSGDSKQGIQIMGILETRNLSFKNVLIIGMNEGSWPKDLSNASFIPYNIRKAFDLPTTEDQDAMQSYLFYRLLHSTKNMWLSYNNISEFNHNGELSRYIRQLQYESSLNIELSNLLHPIAAEHEQSISVIKDKEIQEKLHEFLSTDDGVNRRMSPSAINTYIDCSLKFYFQQIAKIKEPDTLSEDMDASLFGNLLHGAMEHLYVDKKELTKDDYHHFESQIEAAINQSFADQKLTLGTQELGAGRQIIAYEVIKQFIDRIVYFDKKHTPFGIIGLENNLEMEVEIELLDGQAKVGLRGVIDRIDRYQETIRILDYKSGRDDRKFGHMEGLIDGESSKRNKAVFQLFYYCMLYKENNPDTTASIQPGMFNSKDLFDPKFDAKIAQSTTRSKVLNYSDYEDEFKNILTQLLTEIFNTEIPFTQTTDEKKCQYCPYQYICMRA